MAIFNSNTGNRETKLELTVTPRPYVASTNSTIVDWVLKVYTGSTYWEVTAPGAYLYLDGGSSLWSPARSDTFASRTWYTIGSGSKTISHNPNGTKSISVSAQLEAYGGGWGPGILTISDTMTLPTIPGYSVSYNSGGGTPTYASRTVMYGNSPGNPGSPTRTGHTFAGWSPNPTTYIVKGAGAVIWATWTVNKYTVTFNANGGSATASQSVNYGSKASVPANPTRTGHTFAGWTPDIGTVITGNRTFTAVWTVNKYTVSFNAAGGSATASQSVAYGSKATVPTNPTRSGYAFAGWTPDIGTVITGARTFTATWTLMRFTVTFAANGGTATAAQTVDYGNKASTPASPTRTGHTFAGWNPNPATTTIYGHTTINATWTVNTYAITYKPNGGVGTDVVQATTYNQPYITKDNMFTRANYDFTGWLHNNSNDHTGYIGVSRPYSWTYSFDLDAQWALKKYTITFNTNGATAIPNQTITHGNKTVVPTNPALTGYTFTEWVPNINNVVTGPVDYQAHWSLNTYKMTFNTNGGNTIADQYVNHFDHITAPIAIREGYTFAGWIPDINAQVTKPVNFTAKWIRVAPPVEVKFDSEITIRLKDNSVEASRIFKGESYATSVILDFTDASVVGLDKFANIKVPDGSIHVVTLGNSDVETFWIEEEHTKEVGFIEINPMAMDNGVQKTLFQTFRFNVMEAINANEA